MTLVAKKMARDHRQPPCCSLPSLRHTQSQLPSLHFLVAIIAIVGTGSGPWRARAEVPPELSPVEDRPCASPCQGQCFAGKCLFTGDEPASSGSLTQSSIQGTAANHYSADGASSVTPESVPVESLQSAPVHKHGRLRRHAVREANPSSCGPSCHANIGTSIGSGAVHRGCVHQSLACWWATWCTITPRDACSNHGDASGRTAAYGWVTAAAWLV